MGTVTVSKKLLNRLPVYLNYLKSLPDDYENVSATVMARDLNLGDVQVRKDLAKVSAAGRRRTGRSRQQLILDIERYLDITPDTDAILVGTGKLGQALLDYSGFEEAGMNLIAGFDITPFADQTGGGKPVYPLNQLEPFCRHYNVHIGIITVPPENAQEICDCLVSCGIKAIWNFAPVPLKVPHDVVVHSENLAVSLTALRLQMKKKMIEH
ncbi:MAG: redox-sensing transcriptional repressor Rex [Oscillospiraceae bacterium]|nr:redox-sensing transcriptional repressor Rex [Oscillospiraceae bacterium]MBR3949508.1 redox-sensing transcriptional repressor Rex [Oscillospiraceae bacterium]